MADWTTLAGFALLLAGALACVLWPLWRRSGGAASQGSVTANLEAFRARESELGEWLARGELDAAQHRSLHGEAEQLLALDVAAAGGAVGAGRPGASPCRPSPPPPRRCRDSAPCRRHRA